MIEIYRKINKEETLVASVPDDNATLERTLMGADEVTLSVTVSEPLDLRVGDYAAWRVVVTRSTGRPTS